MNIVGKIRKATRTPIAKAGLISLLALTMLLGAPQKKSDSDIIIKTVIPGATNWVADGATEYQMDIYLDSTADDVKDKKIRSAEWDVWVPDFLNVTRAELPDPDNNPSTNLNDFYYNFFMYSAYNWVDDTTNSAGQLTMNARDVDANDGPTNRTGILGSYWFTVNTDAPLGETNFFLSGVFIYDTDYTAYTVMGGLQHPIENQNFNVVPEPSVASSLALGLLALGSAQYFMKRRKEGNQGRGSGQGYNSRGRK